MSEICDEAMPHVALLVLASPIVLLLQRRPLRGAVFGLWLLGAAGVYLACLSYSVVPFYRYAVPVTLLLHTAAALTVALLARMAIERPALRGVIIGLGAGVIGATQLARCVDYDRQFGSDSRLALHDWVAANVPAGASVVVDEYTALHNNQPGITARIIHRGMWAADAGDVDALRRRGFAYVITAGNRCDRYLNPYVHAAAGEERHFARRIEFYDTLARDCPIVWQIRAAHPMETFSNPDLTVYRLFPLHSKQ